MLCSTSTSIPVVLSFVNPEACLLWLNSHKIKVVSGYQKYTVRKLQEVLRKGKDREFQQ